VQRGERHVEALVPRPGVAHPVGETADVDDELRRVVDRVHRVRGERRVRFLASDRAAEAAEALVRDDRLHGGRLAHDAAPRPDAVAGEILEEPAHAEASDLLVVGEREVHRRLEVRGQEPRRRGERGRDIALHVAGAAAVDALVLQGRGERIGVPGLPVDRHDIGVAGEHDARPRALLDRGEQIRLPAGGVIGEPRLDAESLQPVADPLDQPEVRLAARGVESDQTPDPLQGLGLDRQSGVAIHAGLSLAPGAAAPAGASFRWQAASRPGAISRSNGRSILHLGSACGQRGWKWQPGGGARGEGISPRIAAKCFRRASRRGTSASNAWVYG
jgi:hypothetical protein